MNNPYQEWNENMEQNVTSFEFNSLNLNDEDLSNTVLNYCNPNNITLIGLSINNLSNLNILTRFINLEELYLCNNNLTTESIQCLSQLTKLRILALSHNKIDNIDNLSALLNLKELYLDNNDITDASALHNLNLQQLHIINNKLSNINGLYNVNVLVVSQNYIIDNNEIKRFNGLQIAVSYALFCNDLYPNNELLNIIMEYANTHNKYDLELSKNFYNDNKIKLPFIKGKVVYKL